MPPPHRSKPKPKPKPKPAPKPKAQAGALPKLPHTEVKRVVRWSSFHGTHTASIGLYATPDVIELSDDEAPRRLLRHGRAISALLAHCLAQKPPSRLRVIGARWSLSNILQPSDVALDPANLNVMRKVNPAWITAQYKAANKGKTLVFAQGGTHISSINRRLGQIGLALQTSGASDGHRVAGCIATGSHGSALSIGAVHDTVRAVHLITSPTTSVLLQPKQAPCTDEVAAWLQRETGIATKAERDDELFNAALVSLGSLGIVHGLVIEAVPLYRLRMRKLATTFGDPTLWRAIETLDTRPLHPDRSDKPYHFEVVFQPYPSQTRNSAYPVLMWKEPVGPEPFAGPMPVPPELGTDVIGLISSLSAVLDGPLSSFALRLALSEIIGGRYKPGESAPVFPGDLFGPSSTPPGNGTSTEIVVDHKYTQATVQTLYKVIDAEAAAGRFLLGAVALRFVPKSNALLGMNIHPMNTFIELPGFRNAEVHAIFHKCFDALEARGIPFTCHWGQFHGMTRARLETYFKDRVTRWVKARNRLLPDEKARRVFASPLLADVGLDGKT